MGIHKSGQSWISAKGLFRIVDIHYSFLEIYNSFADLHNYLWISTILLMDTHIRIMDIHKYIFGYLQMHLWRSTNMDNYGYPQFDLWISTIAIVNIYTSFQISIIHLWIATIIVDIYNWIWGSPQLILWKYICGYLREHLWRSTNLDSYGYLQLDLQISTNAIVDIYNWICQSPQFELWVATIAFVDIQK